MLATIRLRLAGTPFQINKLLHQVFANHAHALIPRLKIQDSCLELRKDSGWTFYLAVLISVLPAKMSSGPWRLFPWIIAGDA